MKTDVVINTKNFCLANNNTVKQREKNKRSKKMPCTLCLLDHQ